MIYLNPSTFCETNNGGLGSSIVKNYWDWLITAKKMCSTNQMKANGFNEYKKKFVDFEKKNRLLTLE